jgi:hypothetical protein
VSDFFKNFSFSDSLRYFSPGSFLVICAYILDAKQTKTFIADVSTAGFLVIFVIISSMLFFVYRFVIHVYIFEPIMFIFDRNKIILNKKKNKEDSYSFLRWTQREFGTKTFNETLRLWNFIREGEEINKRILNEYNLTRAAGIHMLYMLSTVSFAFYLCSLYYSIEKTFLFLSVCLSSFFIGFICNVNYEDSIFDVMKSDKYTKEAKKMYEEFKKSSGEHP